MTLRRAIRSDVRRAIRRGVLGGGPFDYYLDSAVAASGNGRTAGGAFKTVADLEAAVTPFAGMLVGVARGASFREEIDWAPDGIRVAAYGSGARPIFDASDVLSAGGWTVVGDGSFSRALTLPDVASSFVNVWEDDAFLTLAASQAACASTPGTYFPSAHYGAITLYIHPTTGAPASNGSVYEVTARQYGVRLNGAGSWVVGVRTRKQHANDGSLVLGEDARAIDCRASQGHKHVMYAGRGPVIDGCIIDEAKYNGFGNLLVVFEDTADGSGITIKNTTITLTEAQHSGGSQTAVYHHANSGAFGTLTAENVTIDGGGIMAAGLSGDNGSLLNVTGGLIKNCVSGISYSSDVVIDGGQVLTDMAMGANVVGVNAVASTTVTIQNGTKICMSGLNANTTCLRYNGNGAKFVANGNFFKVNETADYQGYILTQPADYTGLELDFDNNQIGSGDFLIAGVISIGWGANPVTVNSFDGNHYEANAARAWALNGAPTSNTLAEWKARGYDLTGVADGDASSACVVA